MSGGDDWLDMDDLSAWGADTSAIEAEKEKQVVQLWSQHNTVVRLFSSCLSQLRTTGMGGIVGLDYSALDLVARWIGITMDSLTLSQLQVMEAEMVSVLVKR
jgi:hypothetical protein